MVSLQGALSPRERRACPTSRPSASPPSSRKRKWEEGEGEGEHRPKELKLWNDGGGDGRSAAAASSDVDLHLDTPLPPEWQRCLDIQVWKIETPPPPPANSSPNLPILIKKVIRLF